MAGGRMRDTVVRAAAVLTAALLAAACAAPDSGVRVADARPAPGTAPEQPSGTAPTPTALVWSACDDVAGWDCATLTVPLMHDDPGAGRVDLALTRRVATDPTARIGSLVVNPGGPGVSGIEAVRYLDPDLPPEVRARFDLVGFDPRGVGASDGVDCITDEAKDRLLALDPEPDDEAEIDTLLDELVDVATRCTDELGDLLPHVGTQAAARDLDLLRTALGDERLTYLGYSYGTALGAAYAQQFPERVRALVLDGPVDPAGDAAEDPGAVYGDQDFDGAFSRFADACEATPECPVRGDLEELVDDLFAAVEDDPLPADAADPDRPVGPALLEAGLTAPLYDADFWALLAYALRDAAAGDGSLVQRLADGFLGRDPDGGWSHEIDALRAVSCADSTERPTLDEVRDAYVRAYLEDDEPATWPLEDCLGWPAAADPLPPVGEVDTPTILVVGTTGDPATPYANAARMAEALGSAAVLTFEGEGHTAFGGTDACIDAAVAAYLIDGTVPAGDAATCRAEGGTGTGEPAYRPLDRTELRDQLLTELALAGTPDAFAACFADGVTTGLTEEQLVYAWLGVSLAGVDERVAALADAC